ncbi:gamma-glutamyl-gamma-aminobutyrate hydrolase family protein [Frankia sp. CNm7]|uniref:Gamma-glutamyl-gamma-aminobutyrate hydrolase family protein n=1 Tax=Frankia nepalensis TaxID=1836974 RepID=A0A937RGN1_9ACTN|nr:gamma-glutamyl-gamma-aminobutyrate hydrolase family protein [Frankia nepalensis]MBL7498412.1 gamma-glutamyl-gamma-aminobutyrate hydrolase family protein [Frankia nepalensis]MBL7509974.1 gamma-glutamyl-gamma-aminobutyrate hydrolase family protein [Frankia nepalensis]MBL7520192.1 gamma-glutamyl-gamma-aminobutyrate hydrolase family protein [Frankia nepalensis]MBL7629742.1 gamma-glutamyl-gamma-aminobutyrate hydrolase family protein [Frankia nepalensis]
MTTTAIDSGPVGQGGGSQPRAVIVVHDVSGLVATGELGTIGDRIAQHGIRFDLLTAGDDPFPDPAALDLVVIMGSDKSAYDDTIPWLADELAYLREAVRAGTPVLGVCFGGQLLARALGGTVRPAERPELGLMPVTTIDQAAIPTGPWMEAHWDTFTVPPGARRLAWTPDAEQAFRFGPHLGLQFHPEITPTVFETWTAVWQARGHDRELAAMGHDLAALRAEIARRADACRAASYTLFDSFWAHARTYRRARTLGGA